MEEGKLENNNETVIKCIHYPDCICLGNPIDCNKCMALGETI